MKRLNSHLLVFGAIVACVAIFDTDIHVELGVATPVGYIALIWLAYTAGSARGVWATAGASASLTFVGMFLSPAGGEFWKALANRGLAFLAIGVTTSLCLRALRLIAEYSERAHLAEELATRAAQSREIEARRTRAMSSIMQDLRAERENLQREILERELVENERVRLAAIVESSDDAIIGKNLVGIVTSWNAGAESLYGYTKEEMIGQPISRIIPDDRSDEIHRILDEVRRGVSVDSLETVRLCKDGTRRMVSLTVSPILNSQGNTVGASAIARDISERKRAEEELRESAEFTRKILDSLVCFAGVCTPDGTLIQANQLGLTAR